MDSRTNRRLRTTQRLLRAFHLNPEMRERFMAEGADDPVIVALPDDKTGEVFDRVDKAPGFNVRVLMAKDDGRFVVATFHKSPDPSGEPDAAEDEPCPVSVDSDYGLLVAYFETQGEKTISIRAIAPQFNFDLVGAASS